MAFDSVHTAEIFLRDTVTKSVTLGPQRATIFRELRDIQIKPGPNEITIYGLDATVDLDSIRVAGLGSATITDIQTEIVSQKEEFSDVHPSEDDDEGDEVPDLDDSNDNHGVDRSALTKAEEVMKELEEKLFLTRKEEETATVSLDVLDGYGKSVVARTMDVSKVQDYLKLYAEERARLTAIKYKASHAVSDLNTELDKERNKKKQLEVTFKRARDAATKPDRESRARKRRQRQLERLEKQRKQAELSKFWPLRVGQVVLHLDGFTDTAAASPQSSRRCSIVSSKKPERPDIANPQGSDGVNLSLTYVTTAATWTPRYELSLKTPTSSGSIVYRAEYHNFSSETWRDAKVTLSTSQTSFSGLYEKIPELRPWNIKLLKDSGDGISESHMRHWKGGLENQAVIKAKVRPATANAHSLQGYQMQLMLLEQNKRRLLMGSQQQQIMAQRQQTAGTIPESEEYESDKECEMEEEALDLDTHSNQANVLAFQESSRQDYGLTTTYDIPGHRTLPPSSLKRRHVIAELELSKIVFSHVIIPKLRDAAFLKAIITNTSSVALLGGRAGLTLDGTFLGNTAIPDCSPSASFSLSLGVDPGIQVTYAKPTVRRETSGLFNKEDRAIFTRMCRITNTKTTAVNIVILDQVPVSEDERLRINILEPKGLYKEGDSAKIGAGGSSLTGDWGTGTVSLSKGGELRWHLEVEKGKEVRLALDYEARMPTGQKIVGMD
ncbi:hypothetical protein AJ80_06537 [Polytolypa hystricis UAMH7299]|uniref:DUF4139 domain-containing protein n=1 Tax=Polytolypa hystricis (strain UAMH7299) TaxID=1447883 RepID=A0A2B7XWC4_POLH7|nr:hypothetical protein AJ80_06537 [Polytolypa hystricis UAMH7299]